MKNKLKEIQLKKTLIITQSPEELLSGACTHLWNFDEYAKKDASPSPQLADVKITPEIAIHSEFA